MCCVWGMVCTVSVVCALCTVCVVCMYVYCVVCGVCCVLCGGVGRGSVRVRPWVRFRDTGTRDFHRNDKTLVRSRTCREGGAGGGGIGGGRDAGGTTVLGSTP